MTIRKFNEWNTNCSLLYNDSKHKETNFAKSFKLLYSCEKLGNRARNIYDLDEYCSLPFEEMNGLGQFDRFFCKVDDCCFLQKLVLDNRRILMYPFGQKKLRKIILNTRLKSR